MKSLHSTVEYDAARNKMWIKLLGPIYEYVHSNQKKKMKFKFADQYSIQPHQITLDNYKDYIPHSKLEPLQELEGFDVYDNNIPLRKENTMTKNYTLAPAAYANANLTQKDPVETQREYLLNRLYDVFYRKDRDLQKQFFLLVDKPKSLADFLDRVKNGKYTLPEDVTDPDSDHYWSVSDFLYQVNWRLPGQKEDRAGFEKAVEALKEQKVKVNDTIMIADPADGLKALQEFENWTYTA